MPNENNPPKSEEEQMPENAASETKTELPTKKNPRESKDPAFESPPEGKIKNLSKKVLKKLKALFLAGLALIMLISGITFFSRLPDRTPVVTDDGNGNSEVEINELEDDTPPQKYINEKAHYSLFYDPDEHTFSQIEALSDQPHQVTIVSNRAQPENITSEKDLVEGYILKISSYENISREISDLTERKKEKYTLECPGVTEITPTTTRVLDGKEMLTFEVTNCPQNYMESFTQHRDHIVEITQIYRGDIGYKQKYLAETEKILQTFEWIRNPYEEPDIEVFKDDSYRISFIHQVLDDECCSVTPPSIEELKEIVILGDPESLNSEGEVKDKFGIFALDKKNKPFELFLNEQKQSLIQEYKVVEEKNPTDLKEETISIGGSEAVKLTNYAWWGTVIYMESPITKHFLIFVIPEGITDSFQEDFDKMLKTFEFIPK